MNESGGHGTALGMAAFEAWLRTADAILCGLNHAFSNRVSALAVVPLIAGRAVRDVTGLERLATETGKLEDLLRLYRLMERGERAPAEPLQVADAVAEALALLAHHPTARDLTCSVAGVAETLPVLVVPSALVHALVLLLCAAADRLDGGAASGGLHLRYSGDPDWVTFVVETHSPVPQGRAVQVPELPVLAWLVRGASVSGSESRTPEGGVRLELRLATLPNVRKGEGCA